MGHSNRGGLNGLLLLEHHLAAAVVDGDGVLGREASFEDRLRERVLDLRLDRALERPRAVHRVEADLGELGERRVGDLEAVVHLARRA